MKKDDLNYSLSELDELEKTLTLFDFFLQEGVLYSKKEKERAIFLVDELKKRILELAVKGEK